MSYNESCAKAVLEKLAEFPASKKRVLIQDLEEVLPYSHETLEDTCVRLAELGRINATTYTIREGKRIRNIKLN